MAPIPSTLMSSGSKKKEPRYVCLSETKASHSHKTWTEVSSSLPHFLQMGSLLSPIICRCLLRVLCPVSRPITTLVCVLLKDNNWAPVVRSGPERATVILERLIFLKYKTRNYLSFMEPEVLLLGSQVPTTGCLCWASWIHVTSPIPVVYNLFQYPPVLFWEDFCHQLYRFYWCSMILCISLPVPFGFCDIPCNSSLIGATYGRSITFSVISLVIVHW